MNAEPQKRRGRPKGSLNIPHRDLALRVRRIMDEESAALLPALATVAQDEHAPVMLRLLAAHQIGLQGVAYIVREVTGKGA